MEYTSMGSRGKYSSENNLWSRQWSASQPSSRRGSEQSSKDESTVPRTGRTENKGHGDLDRIGASIDMLRRDGELSMGAPPPLTAAFSGSVSNFTHQGSSGFGHTSSRRASRRSIVETPPAAKESDRTADINGDESAVAGSTGNLSQGPMLGSSLGSQRSLHKQKSGEVHRSIPPGLSSINDVSSSAEELDSSAPAPVKHRRKGSANKNSQDIANSLPPKFPLRSEQELNRSTGNQPGQNNVTSSAKFDDAPASNSKSNLQASQQLGKVAKSPYASRATIPTSTTESTRSRNDLKQPPSNSSTQDVSASFNVAPTTGGGSLQAPQQQQEKKAKSPYASRASFKTSNDVLASKISSDLAPRETQVSSANVDENPNSKTVSASQSALQGAGNQPKSAVRGSKASMHKSATSVHVTEPSPDYDVVIGASTGNDSSPYVGYVPSYAQPSFRKDRADGASKSVNLGPRDVERSTTSVADSVPSKSASDLRSKESVDNKGSKGTAASTTHLSRNDRKVRIEETPGTVSSSVSGLGLEGAAASTVSASVNKSATELRDSNATAPTTTAAAASSYTPLTNRERAFGDAVIEKARELANAPPSPKQVRTSFSSLAPLPREVEAAKETHDKASGASQVQLTGNVGRGETSTKPFAPKQVQTSYASVLAAETHDKASGTSHSQLTGTKTFSPKQIQTSFASVVASPPKRSSAETQTKEPVQHENASSGTSYTQLTPNGRGPREGEESSRATKLQNSGDLKEGQNIDATGGASATKKASQPQHLSALPYSAEPSSFVTSVLSSIKARNKAAEDQLRENEAKRAKSSAGEKTVPDKVDSQKATTAGASNASLSSRTAATSGIDAKEVPSRSLSAAQIRSNHASVDDILKNSRSSIPSASESSLFSVQSSRNSIANRRDGNDAESRRLGGKTVSIGGMSSVDKSTGSLVEASQRSFRADAGSEYIANTSSERGDASTNSLRKRYSGGSEGSVATSTKEDAVVAGGTVEPSFERSYAFALKWDPYTLRVKCEHKGEIRLAYLPIRKILDEHDENSCMIVDTFQKLFSDSIHNPDVFDPSRHFLAFLDADGDWCTLGDTAEDYKVFVESSKFDPTKAASRVARLKSFDLSILEDLSRDDETTGSDAEVNADSPIHKTSRRGSIKSAGSVGERSGGRKLMHGTSEDLNELLRKDSFGTTVSSDTDNPVSSEFEFSKVAFSVQQALFMGWLVGAAPMAVAVRHSEFWMTSGFQTEEYHREEPWYDYTIAALGLSILVSFIGFVRSRTIDKQRLGLTLLCVNAISFCSYLSIVAGLTPAVTDIVHRPLEIVRYLDWTFTCPTLVLLMGQLTKTEGNIRRAMIVNAVMITSRFFGSCLPWSYALPFSAASFGCFSFLISDMWRWWSAAVAREATRGLVKSLNLLRVLTTASSVMYPITWLLGISDVVSFEEAEVLYCVADLLAKVVFTMFAVRICFNTSRIESARSKPNATVAKKPAGENKKSTSTLYSASQNSLQRGASVEMEKFESATVIVCDIVGLKEMTNRHTPTSLVKTLKNLYKNFDSIAKVHHIYKVESKGEAFMGVAGAPDRSRNHLEQAAEFALDVLQMIKVFTSEPNKDGQREKIKLRIGIDTGPLSAGIIDRKTLRYGVFGDTVNTAARMESTCDPMGIQFSQNAYKALEGKGGFEFEESEKGGTYLLVGKRHLDID